MGAPNGPQVAPAERCSGVPSGAVARSPTRPADSDRDDLESELTPRRSPCGWACTPWWRRGSRSCSGVVRLINFAHGEFFMLGGYAFWFAYRELGLPYPRGRRSPRTAAHERVRMRPTSAR